MVEERTTRLSVLIVDDDPRGYYGDLIEFEFDGIVSYASTAQAAVQELKANEFNVVILDMMLPDEAHISQLHGGLTVLKFIETHLHKDLRAPIVIIHSAYPRADLLNADRLNIKIVPKGGTHGLIEAIRSALQEGGRFE